MLCSFLLEGVQANNEVFLFQGGWFRLVRLEGYRQMMKIMKMMEGFSITKLGSFSK